MAKKIRRLQKNVKQKDGSFITEHYETDATIVEYDSTNSGLECTNTQEAIDELAKQQKVIEGNIISETTYESKELTIPIEGWTDAAIGQYAKKVSVPVTDLKITDIIEGEVTLDTEEFAQECKLAYQCECTENSVTFFSATLPTSPIKINYYILQGKDGNTSLGKIVYTSSEVVNGFESNSVTKSGSANNDMILNQQVNNNKEDIADLVKQLTEINGKLSALGTTDTDLQTQISELNKNINSIERFTVTAETTLNDITEWLMNKFQTGLRSVNIYQGEKIVIFNQLGNFNIICTKFIAGDQFTGIAINHWDRNVYSVGIDASKSIKWEKLTINSDLGLNIKFGDGYVQVGADNNTSCRFYFDASVRMVSHQNGENYENNFRAISLYNIPIFETFIPTFNNTDTVAITLQHKVIDGGHIFVTNGDFAACPVPIVGIRLPDGDRTNKVEVRFASNIVGVARINILYKPYYS